MKYKYNPEKGYWYGLPARDLDDSELEEYQISLLRVAILNGIFTPIRENPKKVENPTDNEGNRDNP